MRALSHADDGAFTDFLLSEAGVAVVSGSGFGAPGHVRISFATSREQLEKAIVEARELGCTLFYFTGGEYVEEKEKKEGEEAEEEEKKEENVT